MRLWVGTSNAGKLREIEAILGSMGVTIKAGPAFDVEEDGDTFELNASKKAAALWGLVGEPCLADDSGLQVDALQGAPGVFSARYAAQEHHNLPHPQGLDAANRNKLLDALAGIPAAMRTARFVCVVAYCRAPKQVALFRGVAEGRIALQQAGDGGFGYDAVFIPEGQSRTYAELPADYKSAHSHRAHALAALAQHLKGPVA